MRACVRVCVCACVQGKILMSHLQLVANMTSDSYAANIRELIKDTMTQNVSYYGGSYEGRTVPGTTHFNVLAQDGGAVSVTSTINT